MLLEIATTAEVRANTFRSAKYIEGLENRLGRMESLLKMSGLLQEEDNLGTLEKRLADKTSSQSDGGTPTRVSGRSPASESQSNSFNTPHDTPQLEKMPTPRSSMASPEPPKQKEQEVEELSDMMCSLVTNNCGETRYIGTQSWHSACYMQLT